MSFFQPPPGMQSPMYGIDFSTGIARTLRKTFVFVGRASQSEYWWGTLGILLVSIAINLAELLITGPATLLTGLTNSSIFASLGDLATLPFALGRLLLLIPQLSLAFRRLHDSDNSGWFGLLTLVPFLSLISTIVIGLLPTKENTRFETRV